LRLVRIGYWEGETPSGLPHPLAFVDPSWDIEERETLSVYLSRGFIVRAYLGKSVCRVCGIANGALELSDGVFVWPEGLAHYIGEHGVRLPTRFVEHALNRTAALEEGEIDDDWWRSQAALIFN